MRSVIAQVRAKERAKAAYNARLSSPVELQLRDLAPRGLSASASLKRYLQNLPGGRYEMCRRAQAVSRKH